MVKRFGAGLCLLLCCLLCGCSTVPLSQPPVDSLILGTPRMQFQDGEIIAADITTTDAQDGTLQYTYRLDEQVSTCVKQRNEIAQQGVLTYQTYQTAAAQILQKMQVQALLLEGQTDRAQQVQSQVLTYQNGSEMTARQVWATIPGTRGTKGIFRGYFRYDIPTGAMQQGEKGSIFEAGTVPVAFLILSQTYTVPVDGGTPDQTETEYVYIFLME